MNKLIILHGSGGTSKDHWFPYLKKNFTAVGWEVVIPDMPGTEDPQLLEQLNFVEENLDLNEDTVLIAHSLGCPLVMSLLEKSSVKIKKAVLVAGLYDATRPEFSDLDYLQESYDWKSIKQNCDEFIFLHSTNDPWDCDEKEADFVFKQLGGTKIMIEDMGHFGSDTHNLPCKELPIVIKLIED